MDRITSISKPVLIVLAVAMLIGQLVVMTGYLAAASNHRGVVSARDDDAGAAIEQTVNTRLYNQVTSHFYGPVYFRVAHVIAALAPLDTGGANLDRRETIERGNHLILMFVSLASLVGLAYLLVSIISTDFAIRLAGTSCLVYLLLSNETWRLFVFRAHPDHLFGLLVAVATILSFRALQRPDEPDRLRTAALAWGVAAGTKLTILLFAPAVFLLIWNRLDRAALLRTFRFGGWTLLAFLAVGFPASIQLDKSFKAMVYQSQFSVAPTIASGFEMGGTFARQLILPLLFLLVLGIVCGSRRRSSNGGLLRFVGIMHIPLFLLLARRVLSPDEYYPIPFVALSLVCLALVLRSRVEGFVTLRWRPAMLVATILVWSLTAGWTPRGLGKTLAKQTECLAEAEDLYAVVKDLQANGKHLALTPYFPFNRADDTNVVLFWSAQLAILEAEKLEYVGLNSRYYERFFDSQRHGYVAADGTSIAEGARFFALFADKQQTTDPRGRSWQLIRRDDCGFELWQRVGE